LYYCPGFKEAIKSLCHLAKLKDQQQEDGAKNEVGLTFHLSRDQESVRMRRRV